MYFLILSEILNAQLLRVILTLWSPCGNKAELTATYGKQTLQKKPQIMSNLAVRAGKNTSCFVSQLQPQCAGLNSFFPFAHQWKSTTLIEERREGESRGGLKKTSVSRLWPAARQRQQRRVRPGKPGRHTP